MPAYLEPKSAKAVVTLTAEASRASAAEIDVIAALHAASFTEPWDEPWSREFLSRILATPGACALVARDTLLDPVMPVGFALIRVSGDECEILSIGVSFGARRRGIGGALLAAVHRHAARLNARLIVLEVAEDNEPAIKLYCGRGFAAVGRPSATTGAMISRSML